ncbi:related to RNA exonuclease 3 [Saccharomycodes ludwigii]|uniref:RNA exonuclease 3 n=1 Tax=Saccharomycodes ludwigii TaxID=36035 RepID=A0A376B1H5_9ASCO|nr:hypothetical protein SCDLUD_001731 [Saccharomycodes ludwigii]KAH3901946.1 hypothetical protein SCDLUD_001731 [Saccharomycodes ludwigii]SSD58469.1 related to RNA exonuclease 3 [Saccharomycodes ludwigii]
MDIKLRPIDLKNNICPFQDRYKYLQKIFTSLKKYYPRENIHSKLSEKCKSMEVNIAKKARTKQSYNFQISVLLRDIIKYKGDFKKILSSSSVPTSANSAVNKKTILQQLETMLLSEDILKQNNYIMEVPNFSLESQADENKVYVSCRRCDTKFKRDQIMKPTKCLYHSLRKVRNKDKKTISFPCCGGDENSVGCTESKFHVFQGITVEEMSFISEFKTTDDIDGDENVLALDCEMGYTSKGYEMIRLTIVEFFTKKIVYDKIVQTVGEVIDLNSKFSGVHQIDCTTAPTFELARKEFLNKKLINKNSILIGHGLENDVNVMRIVHRRIIDTAILYSSNNKFKISLKELAFQHLSRRIQTGEHDSSEDAIATMDIIKKKINMPYGKEE